MTADTPALFFCHGWLPWEEKPLCFPRIRSYVAVDQVCRDRLVLEGGVPADRVRVVLNFVDTERFQPRSVRTRSTGLGSRSILPTACRSHRSGPAPP